MALRTSILVVGFMAGSKSTIQAELAERARLAVDSFEMRKATKDLSPAQDKSKEVDEEHQGGQESKKRVKFTPSTSNENALFAPFRQAKKHPNQERDAVIRDLWVRLSEAGQYQQLGRSLPNFQLNGEGLTNFFAKEGPYLLMWSILYQETSEPLQFICEYVPTNVLQEALRRKNYVALKGFLLGETGLEEDGLIDERKLKNRVEKINLLLKVDPEGLEAYMDSEYFKTHFAEGVQKSFQEAVEVYKLTFFPTAK